LIKLKSEGLSNPEIAEKMGLSSDSVRSKLNNLNLGARLAAETPDNVEVSADGDRQTVTCKTRTVRTLAEALEVAEVDEDIWEVERWVANKWDVGAKVGPKSDKKIEVQELWQVKVWLRRRLPKVLTDAFEILEKRLAGWAPKKYAVPAKSPADAIMVEVSLSDVHFGKLCWAEETGTSFDLKIARRIYENAVREILGLVRSQRIDKFLLPLGNDFFHFDNMMGATTAGTVVDSDGRYPKVIAAGTEAVIWAVDLMASIAPVEVMWVPGNHDYLASLHLCRELKAWYRGAKHVDVDVRPSPRKYFLYGQVLLGFTHGDSEKHSQLPSIMATEVREDWGATSHHEIHLGHRHLVQKRDFVSVDTHEGTVVRILPSLSGIDGWHHKHGYIGRRAAEAYLWSKRGYLGHFSVNANDAAAEDGSRET